jgi:lipopolysaccharide export LptBFGC system permease protein LptF
MKFKMKDVNSKIKQRAGTNENKALFLMNESLDNLSEQYNDSDDEDEFFRGYNKAKELNHIQNSYDIDKEKQDMRNKLIFEDYIPPNGREMKNVVMNDLQNHGHSIDDLKTPVKAEDDFMQFMQNKDNFRSKKLDSGNNFDFGQIKMLDFDKEDYSCIDRQTQNRCKQCSNQDSNFAMTASFCEQLTFHRFLIPTNLPFIP